MSSDVSTTYVFSTTAVIHSLPNGRSITTPVSLVNGVSIAFVSFLLVVRTHVTQHKQQLSSTQLRYTSSMKEPPSDPAALLLPVQYSVDLLVTRFFMCTTLLCYNTTDENDRNHCPWFGHVILNKTAFLDNILLFGILTPFNARV